jgi:hypothetical protein
MAFAKTMCLNLLTAPLQFNNQVFAFSTVNAAAQGDRVMHKMQKEMILSLLTCKFSSCGARGAFGILLLPE